MSRSCISSRFALKINAMGTIVLATLSAPRENEDQQP